MREEVEGKNGISGTLIYFKSFNFLPVLMKDKNVEPIGRPNILLRLWPYPLYCMGSLSELKNGNKHKMVGHYHVRSVSPELQYGQLEPETSCSIFRL